MTTTELKTSVSLENYFKANGSTQDATGRWRCLRSQCHTNGDVHHSVSIRDGRAKCWSQGCFSDLGADIFGVIGVVENLPDFKSQKRRVEELAGISGNGAATSHRVRAAYRWVDDNGHVAYKIRWETEEKDKCAWSLDPDATSLGKGNCQPTLYELGQVQAVPHVIQVEGEPDADTVNGWLIDLDLQDLVATTTPNGANDVKPAYLAPLFGKATVWCSGDNDPPGRRYQQKSSTILQGQVADLRLLSVPEGVKDWTDWKQSGATAEDFRRLLEAAPLWRPEGETRDTEHTDIPPARPMATRGASDDPGLTKALADMILVSDHFARDAGGALYAFVGGVYRPNGEQQIVQRVKALLVENGDSKHWSSHRAREVVAFIQVDAPRLWDRPPADTVNVLNGLLDLPTRTLVPHTSRYLSSVQLPVHYERSARCPRWESFIARVLPEDCRTLPYELVAASMRGEVSDQKAVLLVGGGDNGKSTLLGGIVSFLGRENVSSLSLQRLEIDKFAVVRLLGKLANICADLPSDHLVSTSTFKALTGGDQLTGERKFQSSFEFTPFTRLLFSTNHYPQSKDSSQAFFRRWLVVPFDTVITPQEKNIDLPRQLADPQELSGVLNQVLAMLPDLIRRGGFSQPETTQIAMREFREMTDPLAAWLDRYTGVTPDGIVTRKDLSILYNADSDAAGRPPTTMKAFCAAVRRLRPTIKEAQRIVSGEMKHVFLGLTLSPNTPHDDPSTSHDSHHSHYFSQISLESAEREREEEKNLKRENGVNGVNDVKLSSEHIHPCFSCHGTHFWKSIHDQVVCATCHPPQSVAFVAEWMGGEPDGKGAA